MMWVIWYRNCAFTLILCIFWMQTHRGQCTNDTLEYWSRDPKFWTTTPSEEEAKKIAARRQNANVKTALMNHFNALRKLRTHLDVESAAEESFFHEQQLSSSIEQKLLENRFTNRVMREGINNNYEKETLVDQPESFISDFDKTTIVDQPQLFMGDTDKGNSFDKQRSQQFIGGFDKANSFNLQKPSHFIGDFDNATLVDPEKLQTFIGDFGKANTFIKKKPRKIIGGFGKEKSVYKQRPRHYINDFGKATPVDQYKPRQYIGDFGKTSPDVQQKAKIRIGKYDQRAAGPIFKSHKKRFKKRNRIEQDHSKKSTTLKNNDHPSDNPYSQTTREKNKLSKSKTTKIPSDSPNFQHSAHKETKLDENFSKSVEKSNTKYLPEKKKKRKEEKKDSDESSRSGGEPVGRAGGPLKHVRQQVTHMERNRPPTPTASSKASNNVSSLEYLSPNNIAKQLQLLARKYEEKANIDQEIIGRTVEYNDIVLWKLSEADGKEFRAKDPNFRAKSAKTKYADDRPEKKIVFIVHGLTVMGWRPLKCLSKVSNFETLIGYYMDNLDCFDIFLIPMANPDGVTKSMSAEGYWNKNVSPQKACAGVNLDRNFDVAWNVSTAKNASTCSPLYPGAHPTSEHETQAIRDVFNRYAHRMAAYFHLHSGSYDSSVFRGDAVLYPKGYTEVQSDDDRYVDLKGEIEEAMRNTSFKVLGVTVDTMYNWYGPVSGTSVDFASSVFGIPYCLDMSMQIYDDDTMISKEAEREQNTALKEIWQIVLDVTFNHIHRSLEDKE